MNLCLRIVGELGLQHFCHLIFIRYFVEKMQKRFMEHDATKSYGR